MTKTGVILEVILEKDTEKEPFSVEQLWASFHGLYIPWYRRLGRAQPYISFEIKSENNMSQKKKEITFNFWVPDAYKKFLKQRILGLYPNAQVNELDPKSKDYIPDENDQFRVVETAEIGLFEHSAFSIKTFSDYDSDPLTAITSAMTELDNREIAVVQVVTRPMDIKWRRKASRVLTRFERTGRKPSKLPEWTLFFQSFLGVIFMVIDSLLQGLSGGKVVEVKTIGKTGEDSQKQKEMLEKVNRYPFAFQIRVLVGTPYGREAARERLHSIISSFNELSGPNNQLKREIIIRKDKTYGRMKNRYLSVINNDDVLSTLELASFAHLPNKNNFTPYIRKIQSKQAENPVDLVQDNAFGVANFRGQRRMVGLDEQARMRHIYITGMTGVGKSVLQENMIINDIENGKGCVVIDPHGELIDTILEKISAKRQDVFVLDPSDIAYPFGMNLLEISSTDPMRRELEKVLVVDSYITVMKRVFGESSIGANTDDLFRMSCSAILDHPEGGGLLEMLLMLTSDAYRARVLQFVRDPIVKNYWAEVFPALAGQGKFLVQIQTTYSV